MLLAAPGSLRDTWKLGFRSRLSQAQSMSEKYSPGVFNLERQIEKKYHQIELSVLPCALKSLERNVGVHVTPVPKST